MIAGTISLEDMDRQLAAFDPEPLFAPSESDDPDGGATPRAPSQKKRKAESSPGKDAAGPKPKGKRSRATLKDSQSRPPPRPEDKPSDLCDYCLRYSPGGPCVPEVWADGEKGAPPTVKCAKCHHSKKACRWTGVPHGTKGPTADSPTEAAGAFGPRTLLIEAAPSASSSSKAKGKAKARVSTATSAGQPAPRASKRLAASASSSSASSGHRERMVDITLPVRSFGARPEVRSASGPPRSPIPQVSGMLPPTRLDLDLYAATLDAHDLAELGFSQAEIFLVRDLRTDRQRMLSQMFVLTERLRQNWRDECEITGVLPTEADGDAGGEADADGEPEVD
ncbi:hypothetical protein B0H21DRAFT_706388 [Amylocystis lapponica]|nr:hypothetical protein B0H21DRAFT_706388 [Amylocystis lapponica]